MVIVQHTVLNMVIVLENATVRRHVHALTINITIVFFVDHVNTSFNYLIVSINLYIQF